MSEQKSILCSKTFWFNMIVALFTVLADHADLLRSYLSDGGYLLVMLLISVGNLYLRTITKTGVTFGSLK